MCIKNIFVCPLLTASILQFSLSPTVVGEEKLQEHISSQQVTHSTEVLFETCSSPHSQDSEPLVSTHMKIETSLTSLHLIV